MQVKPAESAEKGLNFIISMRNSIEQKLENSYNSTNVSSFFICMTQKYVKYYLISLCAVSCMTYEININYYACLRIYIFTHLFTVRLHIYVLLTQQNAVESSIASITSAEDFALKTKQADLWTIGAAVKITRACKDFVESIASDTKEKSFPDANGMCVCFCQFVI